MAERLLTAWQLAFQLGLAEITILNWGRRGKIPRVKLGYNIVRFKLSEVVRSLTEAARKL